MDRQNNTRMSDRGDLRSRLPEETGFARQFLVTWSGSVASRALLVLALPLLTRHYGPTEVGRWQLFVGLLLELETIVNWRYEVAIVLPKSHRRAAQLFWVCLVSAIGMSALWAVPLLLMPRQIAASIGDEQLARVRWILPLVTIGLGVLQIVDASQFMDHAGKGRVGCDVVNFFAVEPDFPPIF